MDFFQGDTSVFQTLIKNLQNSQGPCLSGQIYWQTRERFKERFLYLFQ